MVSFESDAFKAFSQKPQSQTGAQNTTPQATAAQPTLQNSGKLETSPNKDTFHQNKTPNKSTKEKVLDYIQKFSGVVALAAIPVTAFITKKSTTKLINELTTENKAFREQMTEMAKNATDIAQRSEKETKAISETVKKNSTNIWKALAAFTGGAKVMDIINKNENQEISEADKQEIVKETANRLNTIEQTAYNAKNSAGRVPLQSKYTEGVYGFNLLKAVDKKAGFNQAKYDSAIKKIETAAPDYLKGVAQKGKDPLKVGDTLWSVTSEFAPIKEGGLGSVPVELQSNFEKLGIKTPTFIPMYQKNGPFVLRKEGDNYTYRYNRNTEFNLQKVANFKIHSYTNNESKDEPIEIFVCNSKTDNKGKHDIKPIIFVKNDDYFNGSIYAQTSKVEEPEKFAFFSKAVYEFAKAKLDPNSVKGLEIVDKTAYDNIKAPDGLVLNDWQAAPVAALARYKAPMENAYNGLSDDATKKLSDMKILTIGHNAEYQGSTLMGNDYEQRVQATENIVNTLFDNFASDIVKHAETNAPYDDLKNAVIMNKDTGERNVNLLNMGVCLSDYFAPVSKNYAKELVNENEKSHALQWAFEQRDKSGTLKGIINGNDFENLNISKKKGFIDSKTNIDTKVYAKDTPKEEILAARAENKKNLYNQYIKPFTEDKIKDPNFSCVGTTNLPDLTDEEIAQTPIFSYAHRLVGQKGVDIVSEAIKDLYNNWEKDFGDKPKPIFYLGGEDGEGGRNRDLLKKLKEELKPEDSNRVFFAEGYAPNPALMSATDFFLMPSKFEPCGLTQSEAFAFGTPVIATATGGIVDTVVPDGEKQTGILTPDISGKGFYNAMKEGLNTYFDDKPKYEKMITNALGEDFSWIQPGKQGPIYEYLDCFGVDKDSLPDKADL